MGRQHPDNPDLNRNLSTGQFVKGLIPHNKEDLVGQRFGRLIAIIRIQGDWKQNRPTKYLCKCDCGNETIVISAKLKSGHTKSCGCLKNRSKIMVGQKHGRLTILKRLTSNKYRNPNWLCKCDCGNEAIVNSGSILNGHTESCGCLRIDKLREKYEEIREDLTEKRYGSWTVLKRSSKKCIGNFMWLCKCDCGTIKEVNSGSLKRGDSTSCGCKNKVLPLNEYKYPKDDNEKHRLYSKYLTKGFVRGALRGIGFKNNEITNEMVTLKRQQIIMYRTLKQFKEWKKEREDELCWVR